MSWEIRFLLLFCTERISETLFIFFQYHKSDPVWFRWLTHHINSFAFLKVKLLRNTENINTIEIHACSYSLHAAYFVCSLFFQSIISFKVGTAARRSDSHSDMIGNLVQNSRFIFLNPFFALWHNFTQTFKIRAKDALLSSGTIEPFFNVDQTFMFCPVSTGTTKSALCKT